MPYPSYFPLGCPPKDAKNIEITAYRLCENKTVSHDDFLSYYQKGICLHLSENVNYYGVSLIADKNKVYNMLRLPKFKKKYVAEGITKKGLGVIKSTPSKGVGNCHYTWWLKENSQPEKYFFIL